MVTSVLPSVLVSIIVPTLNEVDNIDILLSSVFQQYNTGTPFEVLIADGGSHDGTIDRVLEWETKAPVRLISSSGKRGLAGDVLAAARSAKGHVIVVMDADLSHSPSLIADLVQPIIEGSSDMVVGSRYIPEGATPDWPWARRLLSRAGGLLAWPLTELKDPMSGFFAVQRERLLAVDPEAAGFKIGLEIIAEGGGALRLTEVPIVFRDRVYGESKIGWRQMAAYGRRLLVLAGGAVSLSNVFRFALVGFIGLFVDLAIFQGIFATGAGLLVAHITSFTFATISNYFLNSRWAFATSYRTSSERDWRRYSRFLIVCLLAFALRGSVLAGTVDLLGWRPEIAIVLGVGIAAIVNYLGNAFFVFPSLNPRVPSDIQWRVAAIGVLAYAAVLRLMFLGVGDLMPQEAYYWNYAQHLDIGYLDHPPMVAWLIWLGTNLFGDNEFGVRICAFIAGLVTVFFVFQLTRNLFGKSAAFASVLLASSLPFFFFTGLLMTPDASLTAVWAGTLYFLERALIREHRRAWWGVGICVGVGMLSKYTIVLLGPATLVFLLFDNRARGWFRRPEPYIAIAVAAVLFSPVVVWNAAHDWASFAFQSSRRIQASINFSLHELIGSAAILLTPFGLFAAVTALLTQVRPWRTTASSPGADRQSFFMAVYTIVPLFVFLVFSLFHAVKLNWTGPVWLAVLPAIAATIVAVGKTWRFDQVIRKLWVPTIAASFVFYGLAIHYLVLGFPGTGYAGNLRTFPVAWEEFGEAAGLVEREVTLETGSAPLLIGMDTYFLASELAFYNRSGPGRGQNSVGRAALGRNSLMYDYWFKTNDMRGRTVILFALNEEQLAENQMLNRFGRLGEIKKHDVLKGDVLAGQFFYRVGYDLRPWDGP